MKHVLLAVVGLTPQVITETLYALHQEGLAVDAVHIITTRAGKERLNASLLSPVDGMYFRYLREYGIDPGSIDFGFHSVHTVTDENGDEITDINGEEENERLLHTCLEWASHLTRDPASVVFFSIAGGRKTMSACLMAAAQFFGRPRDRVYHVLISPEFESNSSFFYPSRNPFPIELKDSEGRMFLKDASLAKVSLVHIPFVSVRNRLAPGLLDDPGDPRKLAELLVRADPQVLSADLWNRTLTYRKRMATLRPTQMALYAFFLQQKIDCTRDRQTCGNCTECYLDFQQIRERQPIINALYGRITGQPSLDGGTETGITALDATNFNSYKAKIKAALGPVFGRPAAGIICIEGTGRKPDTRYGIRIDRKRIRIV